LAAKTILDTHGSNRIDASDDFAREFTHRDVQVGVLL
jgi:hypothetical protein